MTEHDHAKLVAEYLNTLVAYKKIVCYTKTAQETFTRSWGTKMRQKSEGVQRGIPDYVIVTKKALLFVELKKQKGVRGGNNGSQVSDEQKVWIESLQAMGTDKIQATVAWGADEAIDFINKHI